MTHQTPNGMDRIVESLEAAEGCATVLWVVAGVVLVGIVGWMLLMGGGG